MALRRSLTGAAHEGSRLTFTVLAWTDASQKDNSPAVHEQRMRGEQLRSDTGVSNVAGSSSA